MGTIVDGPVIMTVEGEMPILRPCAYVRRVSARARVGVVCGCVARRARARANIVVNLLFVGGMDGNRARRREPRYHDR